jgi:hypothetical protein
MRSRRSHRGRSIDCNGAAPAYEATPGAGLALYAHHFQSDGQPNRPAGAPNAQFLIVQEEQR